MSKARLAERQADVQASTARLAEAVAQPESDMVRDATIQRFEFTFEVVWKTLKLWLEHQGHECGGPRPTLKKAFAEGLIPTPEAADRWLQMLDDRNATSHAYDEATAYRFIPSHHGTRSRASSRDSFLNSPKKESPNK